MVDRNFRADHQAKAEWGREFEARFLRVRGALKVKCHLMFGIVAPAVDQIIRVVDLRTAPA